MYFKLLFIYIYCLNFESVSPHSHLKLNDSEDMVGCRTQTPCLFILALKSPGIKESGNAVAGREFHSLAVGIINKEANINYKGMSLSCAWYDNEKAGGTKVYISI